MKRASPVGRSPHSPISIDAGPTSRAAEQQAPEAPVGSRSRGMAITIANFIKQEDMPWPSNG
jgi:hypothetical protein